MKSPHHLLLYAILLNFLLFASCKDQKEPTANPYITIENGQFMRHGNPYYFIGTNFWYGPILGSQSEFGDRDRLIRELDFMKENGITNLRVLVGAEGPEGVQFRIIPTLQKTPGQYEAHLWDGLDFFMSELGKRDMTAVLFLTNNWDWSGGYMQYLTWANTGTQKEDGSDDWMNMSRNVGKFYTCDECLTLFKEHIATVIGRTNYYTNQKYSEDPHILSWQIANEPRPMNASNADYIRVLSDISAYIKQQAPNHLVSTGSEGEMGSADDIELFRQVHADPYIDYLTIHMWPKNWSWLNPTDIPGSMERIIVKADDYLDRHLDIARHMNKPIVLEEFGMPRDNHLYELSDPTQYRNRFYTHIFNRLLAEKRNNGIFAGCNFWAWGGFARPNNEVEVWWQKGDDYMGDPGMEEQGLNSVFDTDATIPIIASYAKQLEN